MFKLDYDPRIIGSKQLPDGTIKKGIGNFIREWSIDEFPQFFNVLKGELSLVGTRPPTVDEWEQYELHQYQFLIQLLLYRHYLKQLLILYLKMDADI